MELNMSVRVDFALILIAAPFLLVPLTHAQQRQDVAPDQVVGTVGGDSNRVLDQEGVENFNRCLSNIAISAGATLTAIAAEIERCRQQAREDSSYLPDNSLSSVKESMQQQYEQRGIQ